MEPSKQPHFFLFVPFLMERRRDGHQSISLWCKHLQLLGSKKTIGDSIPIPSYRFMKNQYMPDSGSKVNGLEQPFLLRRVHCHSLHIQDGL